MCLIKYVSLFVIATRFQTRRMRIRRGLFHPDGLLWTAVTPIVGLPEKKGLWAWKRPLQVLDIRRAEFVMTPLPP